MKEAILHTRALAVGYHGVPLLQDIEITVQPGQILTLIGPNGAGKSTILKSITRQLQPIAGTVYLGEKALNRLPQDTVARSMSLLMTQRTSPEWMSCEEVVNAGRYPYTGRLGILTEQDKHIVTESMELVHVEHLRCREFRQLSDGQRQRVMLARAICQQPEVLVMDEPTSYLDLHHKLELLSILKQLVREKNMAVILSLHELDLAQKISDQILCVRSGAVDRCAPPEEIFSDDYIRNLYQIQRGSYHTAYGSLELEAVTGVPRVFVIGGGGSGIPFYRFLQRQGIPFAVGILPENDMDIPVAKALASQVITEAAYEPIRPATLALASKIMQSCPWVLCSLPSFGSWNQPNRQLLEQAQGLGKLRTLEEFKQCL